MTQPAPDRPTNRLSSESSAYLRQHMFNPVDWYPWGEDALERAKREDRPLLISIGYSACHWCHVMERESFENVETAELMNRLFVNIKVDREERPDLDQLYMDTVVRLTGRGGWPLTLFCTPEGRPFYGGTYFPPSARQGLPSFRQVLQSISDTYRTRRTEVEKSSAQILDALAERPRGVAEAPPGRETLAAGARQLMQSADLDNGGFGGAPKFPTPTSLEMLLAALDVLPPDEAKGVLAHCVKSCREMARRGLFDQLGGGFHRYCVDADWSIPHFEKMLYDQGLLLRVYLESWRRSGANDAELLWPIHESVAYLRREMCDSEGGFYASQDADSEGEEGKFYVWDPEEVERALGARADPFCEAYSVTWEGNFEAGRSHLIDRARRERREFSEERDALLAIRAERIPPATDRKRVASWNGYMISGLARAGSLLEDSAILDMASRAADLLLTQQVDAEGQLLRIFNDGRAQVSGFLDDYASILDACLDLYRAGAGTRFSLAAEKLAGQIATRFFDEGENDFFLSPADGERLVSRPRSDHDGATPHASGLATLGLLRTAELSGHEAWRGLAERVIRSHAFAVERAPHAYPTLLRAIGWAERGPCVAVIIGEESDPATRALAHSARLSLAPEDAVVVASEGAGSLPGVAASWLAGRSAQDGRATAYLCRGRSCSLPVTTAESLADLATEGAASAR